MGTVPPLIKPKCCVPDCDLQADDQLPLDPPVPLCEPCRSAIYGHFTEATFPGLREWTKRMTEPRETPTPLADRPGHVYFVRLGDRMKIGWSSQWEWRLTNVPHEEVLLIVEGSLDAERAQHQRFAEHRIKGEWFAWNPETKAMVEKLARWQARQHDEPVGTLIPR